MASINAHSFEQKKAFTQGKSSTSAGFVGNTKMASFSLFCNTNMAAVEQSPQSLKQRKFAFDVVLPAVIALLLKDSSTVIFFSGYS